jgi:hypothetical protein
MLGAGPCQDHLQLRVKWNGHDGAGLALAHRQEAAADMLAPHSDDVAAALSGVEQEREGEPRPRPDRVDSFNAAMSSSVHVRNPCAEARTFTRIPIVGSDSHNPTCKATATVARNALRKFFAA